nr:deoxycytidylate deaminase-like isoform X2 [Geotrypetes seraphini]XP_033798923.1 deoxycytidylate deaminase-like isoform X2 [Geotrypetes seraphini]
MAVAVLAAKQSRDPHTQVGACIVSSENRIVGIGYNKMPNDCTKAFPWDKEAASRLDTKYPYISHAELNAFVNKTVVDVRGCRIYVTLFPCNECAKIIIQSGIHEVIYLLDKYPDKDETRAAKRLFENTGIHCRKFKPKNEKDPVDFYSVFGANQEQSN